MRGASRDSWARLLWTALAPGGAAVLAAGFAFAGSADVAAVDIPDDDADGDRTELEELAALEATVHPVVMEAYGLRAPHAHAPGVPVRAPLYGKDVLPPALMSPGRAGIGLPTGPVPKAPADLVRAALGVDPDHLADLDLPFEWRAPIARYAEFFLGKGRRLVERWIARSGRYFPMIEAALSKEGLPLDLAYVTFVESGLNPKALSVASASGLWQFMRATGAAYGLVSDYWIDERRIPERATEAAATHLKALHAHFGTWELALAAYNAGGGSVTNAIKKFGTNDFWELARYEALPEQTRMYVPKVLAAAMVAKNRAALGFGGVGLEAPLRYEYAHVPGSVDLAVVAKAAGVSADLIRTLNPELKRCCTPPDRSDYAVRLPEGSGRAYAEAIAAAWPKSKLEFVRHVVRLGDTMKDIAKRYGTSVAKIASMNTVKRDSGLHAGLVLVVPRKADLPPPALLASAAVTRTDAVLVMVPAEEFRYPDRVTVYYAVRRTDDLLGIAATFGVTAEEIALWNGLDRDAELMTGMVMRLYVKKGAETRAVLLDPSKVKLVTRGSEEHLRLAGKRSSFVPVGLRDAAVVTSGPGAGPWSGKVAGKHVVRKGDSLWKIAKLYKVEVSALKAANGLVGKDPMLSIGRELIIPGTASAAAGRPAAGAPAPGTGAAKGTGTPAAPPAKSPPAVK